MGQNSTLRVLDMPYEDLSPIVTDSDKTIDYCLGLRDHSQLFFVGGGTPRPEEGRERP